MLVCDHGTTEPAAIANLEEIEGAQTNDGALLQNVAA